MKRLLMLLVAIMTMPIAPDANARSMIVIVPPDYAAPKDGLVRELAATVSALGSDDQLLVVNAAGPKRIGTVSIPRDPRVANLAWRQRQLGEQFAPILRHIAALPAHSPSGSIPGHVDLPELAEELGQNVIPTLPGKTADILVLGSWLYAPARDGRFAMTDRFYPRTGTSA